MPQNFLSCDRDQSYLMPPSLREWLDPDHLAWFVIEAVEGLDLGAFHAAYRPDGHGRPAHDPRMMVALFAYAYAVGERSSRGIERRLSEDVAFRVIAANRRPDHATIARFRALHEQALSELFSQVLCLCARAGIVSGELLALDSTKIAANASGQLNRSYDQIAREILEEAAETDAREDELYGPARGDELPEGLRDSRARRAWLQRATRELQAEREARSAAEGPAQTRPERLGEAKRRLEEEHALELAAEQGYLRARADQELELAKSGKKIIGRRPSASPLPTTPQGRVNTTDPDSSPVKTHRGFIQGYNAQAIATKEQIIVACEIAGPGDGGQLSPMVGAARDELKRAGLEAPQIVLADAGYWSRPQIEELQRAGIDALVPPDGHARTKPSQRSKRAGLYAEMREKLRSERGSELYRQRQMIIEPVFAQTKVIRGADRFQRRGLAACRSELKLIAATHNLLKLWRAGSRPLPA